MSTGFEGDDRWIGSQAALHMIDLIKALNEGISIVNKEGKKPHLDAFKQDGQLLIRVCDSKNVRARIAYKIIS